MVLDKVMAFALSRKYTNNFDSQVLTDCTFSPKSRRIFAPKI